MFDSLRRTAFPYFFVGTAMTVAMVLAYQGQFVAPRESLVGKTAPDFEAPGLDGGTIRLSDARGGTVLVNFWATWCPPCRDEMPVLNELHGHLGNGRLRIISLMEADAESPAKAKAILEEFEKSVPVKFSVYHDRSGLIADSYGTYKLPESYLIAPDGRVVKKYVGPISAEEGEELLRELLQQPIHRPGETAEEGETE